MEISKTVPNIHEDPGKELEPRNKTRRIRSRIEIQTIEIFIHLTDPIRFYLIMLVNRILSLISKTIKGDISVQNRNGKISRRRISNKHNIIIARLIRKLR